MSIKINGMKELEAMIEAKYGKAAVERISDEALTDAANVFVQALIKELETFKDQGFTIDEVTLTEPYTLNGVRTISVKWEGPKGRYRLIHLNEFGTVKNPNPRGKGAIARALQNSKKAYKQAIKNAIERGL